MTTRRLRWTAFAVVGALLAAGCGGDDDAEDAPATDAVGVTPDASPPTTPVSTGGDASETTVETSAGPATTPETPPATTSAEAVAPAADTTQPIRFANLAAVPPQWDPAASASIAGDITYFPHVYDALVRVTAGPGIEPQLAASWEFDEAGTTLELTLRDDVTFTDGSAFDASVAKLNLDRIREGTGAAAPLLAGVAAVEAPSPTTLQIVLTQPDPTILYVLGSVAGLQASPLAIEAGTLGQQPVGSGPFVLTSVTQTVATFDRNLDYWDQDASFPTQKVIIGTADENARINAFLSGEADVAQLRTMIPDEAEANVASGEWQLAQTQGQILALHLNNDVAPLDQPEVRRAIAMAIDRSAINDALFGGRCRESSQVIPEGFPGHVDGLSYDYDPDAARQLLADAGVTSFDLEMIDPSYEPVSSMAIAVQGMLAEIGVNVTLTRIERAQARPEWRTGEYGAVIFGLQVDRPDAVAFTERQLLGPDNPGTHDPEVVALADVARPLPLDSDERREAYEALSEYLFDSPVHVPLCQEPTIMLATSDVLGVDALPVADWNSVVDSRDLVKAAS